MSMTDTLEPGDVSMARVQVPKSESLDGDARVMTPLYGPAYWISGALALVTALATALTFFVPDVLRGTAVMNGSGRGTALVALIIGVPVLVVSMLVAARGSMRGVLVWLGAVAFLLYQSILLLFATPFNGLFLLYCLMWSLTFWAAVATLRAIDVDEFAAHFDQGLPVRGIAIFLWVVGALNALAWLGGVVPALFSSARPDFLVGTGLTTNPIYVQDLSFWIPLVAISAWWLWLRRPWGYVLAGALLVFFVFENITIAVDQYMGHAADPASSVASDVMTPVFTGLAMVTSVPLFLYMRHLNRASTNPSDPAEVTSP
jgi:hypothetical protein